ncbi:uncharacterized protein F5891DRAFT_1064550 [Suillus fuscotomentosus]|uniref:F-box domain-containing protein n=1 Tax=Suillus fuscotomentosus TaxID=1912939 RepID=A0AAD4DTU5_9AGAM|nr:uncharacterized protein F5891DRAFT_1087752 [Suillus fuscotomentosus]XP_041219416.1 uncharacterized protein F5891DRAFT_1064550 [Suillus fuscotomentosus]KAG1885312.1 hypothetical protein F5891DRAFT_1087752 [Suillus fuscotomentosus]KAG1893840.1 hypothetical protein F5891DRAFT_1064550 [Suillus fuscotomentosus]
MAVGLSSLPTELICHILLFLTPKDICRCAITCKIVWDAVQNSVHIQYKLELYAQGLNETDSTNADSIGIASKMCSLKNLASLWRSGFHVNTVFQDAVTRDEQYMEPQFVKCGTLWVWRMNDLLIRDCKKKTKPPQMWPEDGLFQQSHTHNLTRHSVVVDPLQDLVVAISSPPTLTWDDARQDQLIFWVDFWLASSQLPHPDSACTSLECRHTCEPDTYAVHILSRPAICGDRIVVLYHTKHTLGDMFTPNMFIQVIDWRKGHVKRHALWELGERLYTNLHLVDKHTMLIINSKGYILSYTLQGLDGSPRCRATYLLPILRLGHYLSADSTSILPYCVVYASPSFHGTVAHPGLMPSYVPSPESQIMILEILPISWPVMIVIDMAMFSEKAIRSETPVEIPWSDWGPKYTWCFPHHPSHRISVFGSKMAYALPLDHTPEPGQRVEALSPEGNFYIHIWDFNKRLIARSENTHDPDSPEVVIRKPGRFAQSCFDEDLAFNRPYIASVCAEPFSMRHFDRVFLEQDRLTLTRLPVGFVDIQVVSPISMEVGLEHERHREESL